MDEQIQRHKKNEKNVKTAIISANNHYASFGPVTAKLFAEMMMNLKNHVRSFPIIDYKIPSSTNETSIFENSRNYRIYKTTLF